LIQCQLAIWDINYLHVGTCCRVMVLFRVSYL